MEQQNDENIYRSPVRKNRIILEIESPSNKMHNELPQSSRYERRGRTRSSTNQQKVEPIEEEAVEVEDELGTSIYERIKRRRKQQQIEEDAAPPTKRRFTSNNRTNESDEDEEAEEEVGRRYMFRQNRQKVIRLQDEFAALNNKMNK